MILSSIQTFQNHSSQDLIRSLDTSDESPERSVIITDHAKDRFEKRAINECFNTSDIYKVFDKIVKEGNWSLDHTSEIGRWKCVYTENEIEYTFIFEKDKRTCVTILSPQLVGENSPKSSYYTDEFDKSKESMLFHLIQDFANSQLNDYVRNPKLNGKRETKIKQLLPSKFVYGKDFSKWPRKKKIIHLFGRALDPRSLNYLISTLKFNPNAIDKRGCTALHHICWRIKNLMNSDILRSKDFDSDMFESIKVMLEGGVDTEIENIEEDGKNKKAFDFLLEIKDYEKKLPDWLLTHLKRI